MSAQLAESEPSPPGTGANTEPTEVSVGSPGQAPAAAEQTVASPEMSTGAAEPETDGGRAAGQASHDEEPHAAFRAFMATGWAPPTDLSGRRDDVAPYA